MSNIKILEPSLNTPFIQLPVEVLKMEGLSSNAKVTYGMLLSYCRQKNSCFPGQERLSKDMGCSERSIRKYLNELRKFKLVDWHNRALGKTNMYYILALPSRLDRKQRSYPIGTGVPTKYKKIEVYKDKGFSNENLYIGFNSFISSVGGEFDDIAPYIKSYLDQYETLTGKEHPPLSKTKWKKVCNNLMTSIAGFPVSEISLEEWEEVIDQWFNNSSVETDYNIAHFSSGKIIENRFYERCY